MDAVYLLVGIVFFLLPVLIVGRAFPRVKP